MRLVVIGMVLSCSTAGAARDVSARTVRFSGPHPIAIGVLKGMCHIPGRHVHGYQPTKPLLHVKAGADWTFVGDPVEYEVEAPKAAYYGHHPLFWIEPGVRGQQYCYISGPHHHWHAPPGGAKFKRKGNVYWYVGGHPAWYQAKHYRVSALRAHYHKIGVPMPVVEVGPPAGFVGVVVGAAWWTGHVSLKWKGGRWWAASAALHPWYGHKWKRPKWKHGHWTHAKWRLRWKRRGYTGGKHHGWKGGMRHRWKGGMGHRWKGGKHHGFKGGKHHGFKGGKSHGFKGGKSHGFKHGGGGAKRKGGKRR